MKNKLYSILMIVMIILVPMLVWEILLHAYPSLLPSSFLKEYPVYGINFFYPGFLDKMAIESVPTKRGKAKRKIWDKPLHDMVHMGMLNENANPDITTWQAATFYEDINGFPNKSVPDKTDILLLGDSNGIIMGLHNPNGLANSLKEKLKKEVYNLSFPGIAIIRQEWLYDNYGSKLNPKVVILFFYGGNDLKDVDRYLEKKSQGYRTYGEYYKNSKKKPVLYLPKVLKVQIANLFAHKNTANNKNYLPALKLQKSGKQLWFYSINLLRTTYSKKEWSSRQSWIAYKQALLRLHNKIKNKNSEFVVVYIPSREELYLPYIEKNTELLYKMLNFNETLISNPSKKDTYTTMIKNSHSIDELLSNFCNKNKINYLSLNPIFEKHAKNGELIYFAADTHWSLPANDIALIELLPIVKNLLNN